MRYEEPHGDHERVSHQVHQVRRHHGVEPLLLVVPVQSVEVSVDVLLTYHACKGISKT